MVLSGLGKSLSGAVNKILNRGPIDKQAILELKNEIFRSLLEADINFNLASQ
ncbi:MAG: signal recognition particle receptor subunit alpha, partial [Candidatus Heimdallarchaeota archaeon]